VPFRRFALALAIAAGLHGLLYVPLVSTHVETDSWTYIASANAIRDGSYSTPLKAGFVYVYPKGWFDITGAPLPRATWQAKERQAFRPPGYPLYLSLFGRKDVLADDHTVALLGQAVLFSVGAWLLMLTVRSWWGERVALASGLLYAVDPWSKHYVPLVLSETLAGTVAVTGLYAFTRAWQKPRVRRWALTGALAGALALVRAVFVLAAPLAVLAAALRRGSARERLVRAAVTAACSALLLVPWLAWTNHVAGRPTMSVWGEGYNLILAASGEGHDATAADVEARPEFRARPERIHRLEPSAGELLSDPTAHPRYLQRADAELRREAQHLYRERLGPQVVWEGVYRAWFLWSAHEDWSQPSALRIPFLALDFALLGFALAGSALGFSRGGAGRAAVVLLGAYTVVLATHHVEARFGMPLRGIFLAVVALALSYAVSRGRRQGDEQERAQPEGPHRRAPDGGEIRLADREHHARDDDARGGATRAANRSASATHDAERRQQDDP
jgi:dolichyl-phosphate-mannose-protein mannosyltransferase